MRVLIAAVCLLAGCDKLFTLTKVEDPADVDAGEADAPDATPCPYGEYGKYGANNAGLYRACLNVPPQGDYMLPPTLDTRIMANCSERVPQLGAAQDLCVVTATNIVVNAPTRVIGNIPIAIVATETITISSSLDAGSLRGIFNGPGNNHGTCFLMRTEDGAAGAAATAAGGGAGGTFQTLGGVGGAGEAGSSKGGVPDAIDPLSFIRGGCGGGDGGLAGALSGGGGGASGGAIYLVAGTSITLTASALVNASGAGGGGGGKGSLRGGAGGGGGSGGLIGFDSPQVVILAGARVIANGGGGGGSAGSGNGQAGENGMSADVATAPFTAAGGTTVTPGGNGADVMNVAAAGADGAGAESGGGGGGGAGYIKVYTTSFMNAGELSPAAN